MKSKIYDVIEVGKDYPTLNRAYSIFMLICIVLSLIPLAYKESTPTLEAFDKITVTVFIIDYILRLFTANCKYGQGFLSYIRYPFSAMAIVDLLSILPSLTIVNKALKTLRLLRLLRLTRALRITKTIRLVKVARYSQSADMLATVIRKSKESLILLTALAIGYILATALIIFNVEPQTFNSFFDAVYWATVSLTTVGYGDIYTVSTVGKTIAMMSSFVGIAIVALPSGIITAGLVKELDSKNEKSE